jgi:hypothetical protein
MAVKMFSPKELADMYGQSDATVKRHCVSRKLPATKLKNGHWIIAEADAYTYAMSMGWSLRVDIADQIVWAPIKRRDIRFHWEVRSGETQCGRSTLSKTSIRVRRGDAMGWGLDPCHICFGEDPS